jgi:hypothetical protein
MSAIKIPTMLGSIYLDSSGHVVIHIPPEIEARLPGSLLLPLQREVNGKPVEEIASHSYYWNLIQEAAARVDEFILYPGCRTRLREERAKAHFLQAPIMPPSDMELSAFLDRESELVCVNHHPEIPLTIGKKYPVSTWEAPRESRFRRDVPTWDDQTGFPTVKPHTIQVSSVHWVIAIDDDHGKQWMFTDQEAVGDRLTTEDLWKIFERPVVPTVKELVPEKYQANWDKLTELAILSGFEWFPNQQDYIARLACKDFGIAAAETGVGKTLIAIALAWVKDVDRVMIVAPKGVIKGKHEGFEYVPSQWEREIERFCPIWPIHRVHNRDQLDWLMKDHNGTMPRGIYVCYPQALFTNGAVESLGPSMLEADVCGMLGVPPHPIDPVYYRAGIGDSRNGIKCVIKPSLATVIGSAFDMIILDEAHFMQSLDSQITQGVLRLQSRYRYGLTATPIPDVVDNVFALAGWIAVPDWFLGKKLNPAWPYTVTCLKRFQKNFMSKEEDLTRSAERVRQKKGRIKTVSPIISSPSRLLRSLKPILAYINKERCNPDLVPKTVTEVRVPFGRQQAILYRRYLNQKMIPSSKDEHKAVIQQTVLRSICADPATCQYNDGSVRSNFNAKAYTVMELITQALERGEQVVVVSSRTGITDEIAKRLRQVRVDYTRIDGELNSDYHSAQADLFKRGVSRVLLMGIKLAQGFSFDRCPNLIVTSLEWNFKTREQAFGRVWRMTSTLPAKIWVVLHEHSIEEVMYDKVATKESAVRLCLEGRYLPDNYSPVSGAALLANHIIQLNAEGAQSLHDESYYENLWPSLAERLKKTMKKGIK